MIKTVLFDVDGVLLSEERYFDASALTVWEVLHSKHYLGLAPEQFKTDFHDEEIASIREQVFENDRILKFMKSCGLNANWDMIYVVVCYQLICLLEQAQSIEHEKMNEWVSKEIDRFILRDIGKTLKKEKVKINFKAFLTDFAAAERTKQGLFTHLDRIACEKLKVEKTIFSYGGKLWDTCEHISQEWYVGDIYVHASTGRQPIQRGKKGFLANEKVLAPVELIADLFASLKDAGIVIGIGTGRPELETIEPFKNLNWLKYFSSRNIVTADDVLLAERELGEGSVLSKPHPYTYILALSGKTKTVQECIAEPLPIQNGQEVLIVGDSLADLLAARKMGCSFAAVLTGLSGKDARAEFEAHHVENIFDSVLDIKEFVRSGNNL